MNLYFKRFYLGQPRDLSRISLFFGLVTFLFLLIRRFSAASLIDSVLPSQFFGGGGFKLKNNNSLTKFNFNLIQKVIVKSPTKIATLRRRENKNLSLKL